MKFEKWISSEFRPAPEVVIPDYFPKIYMTDAGRAIIFLGAILNNSHDMSIGISPWWAEGKHSTDKDVQDRIIGFYRLEKGIIYKSKFIDEETYKSFNVAEVDAYLGLPDSATTRYGICEKGTQNEISALSRMAFGLTYDELDSILKAYGMVFNLGNVFQQIPRITRSNQKNNACDLSDSWIPRGFPYVAFAESQYAFSHVSLNAFYQYFKLLLINGKKSIVWDALAESGANKTTLEQILEYSYMPYPAVRYREFCIE